MSFPNLQLFRINGGFVYQLFAQLLIGMMSVKFVLIDFVIYYNVFVFSCVFFPVGCFLHRDCCHLSSSKKTLQKEQKVLEGH